MARADLEAQVVQFRRRHRDLLIVGPVASDRGHPHPTAVHFPKQIIQGVVRPRRRPANARRFYVARRRRSPTGTRICLPPDEKRGHCQWLPHAVHSRGYPFLLVHVPHGRDPFLVARTNPLCGLKKIPIGFLIYCAWHSQPYLDPDDDTAIYQDMVSQRPKYRKPR